MAKERTPDLDEATLQIAKRILSTPPKQHKEMKIGKRRAKAGPRGYAPKNGKGPGNRTGPQKF
jgi:hypothetical protein